VIFTQPARHLKISKRIITSDSEFSSKVQLRILLGYVFQVRPQTKNLSELWDLSLRSLAKLRDELESCWCAVEIYGMIFESFYPYWTCLADRV
jgi:hypothetical protein